MLLFTGITLAQDVSKFELGDPVTEVVQKALDFIKLTLPDLPEPPNGLSAGLCTMIENKDYAFEKLLWQISGIDEKKNSHLVIIAKVQKLFDEHWGWFSSCNHLAFDLQNGNIFKYSVNRNFFEFIDFMAADYNIDINRPDPSDNKTLLDFVTEEIERNQRISNAQAFVKKLEELYKHLVNDYGAKHASELKP